MSKKYFSDGLLIGVILGAVAGILLAPAAGNETRKKLRKMRDDNDEFIQDTKDKTELLVSKTLDAINKGFNKLTKMLEDR